MAGLGIKINKNTFAKGNEAKATNKGGDYPDNVDLEPGVYPAILVGGRGVDAGGEPKLVYDFLVGDNDITDDSAGKQVSMWFSLETDAEEGKRPRIIHLYNFLEKIGYEVDELNEAKLIKIHEEIAANPVAVQLSAKRGGDYINIRLKKVLEDTELTDILSSYEGGGEAEDDAEDKKLLKMDRNGLKKHIAQNKLDVKVFSNMSDNDIRAAIKKKSK